MLLPCRSTQGTNSNMEFPIPTLATPSPTPKWETETWSRATTPWWNLTVPYALSSTRLMTEMASTQWSQNPIKLEAKQRFHRQGMHPLTLVTMTTDEVWPKCDTCVDNSPVRTSTLTHHVYLHGWRDWNFLYIQYIFVNDVAFYWAEFVDETCFNHNS